MVSVKQEGFEKCWMRSGYERITGSLSNYDDDHNDNFKKQFVLWAKQQLCSCIMLFVHFFDFHCTTIDVPPPSEKIGRRDFFSVFFWGRGDVCAQATPLRRDTSADATFYRGRGHTTTNSPFSFWTLIIQLQEKSPAFDILRGFKYTRLSLKERKFSDVFTAIVVAVA